MSSTNENKHIRNVRRRATSALTSLHLDTINPSLRGVIVCHRSYLLLIAAAKVPAATETRGRGPRKHPHTCRGFLAQIMARVAKQASAVALLESPGGSDR